MNLKWVPKVLPKLARVAVVGVGAVVVIAGQRKARHGLIGKVLHTKVEPVYGSVLCCDLGGVVEHSGIYVGENRIVHLDGEGKVVLSSPKEFKARLYGFNPVFNILIACHDKTPIGSQEVGDRALEWVGKERGYHLLLNNCHQFCRYCLTGEENTEEKIITLSPLERELKEKYEFNTWLMWDKSKWPKK